MGLGDMAGHPPELSSLAETARHCWHFCDGWHPERLVIYAALYPVSDWHQLVDTMQEIRKAL